MTESVTGNGTLSAVGDKSTNIALEKGRKEGKKQNKTVINKGTGALIGTCFPVPEPPPPGRKGKKDLSIAWGLMPRKQEAQFKSFQGTSQIEYWPGIREGEQGDRVTRSAFLF